VVEVVVHQLPKVLEPGPLVERDCSTSGVILGVNTPGGSREVEQIPSVLGIHTGNAVRLRDVHRLDVCVDPVQIARLWEAVHQREEAPADGFATVDGNDRAEVTCVLRARVGEPRPAWPQVLRQPRADRWALNRATIDLDVLRDACGSSSGVRQFGCR
jgi:hypothetical protein